MANQHLNIIDMVEVSRVRVFELKKGIPLSQQLKCPSCDKLLKPVFLLVSGSNDQKIRLGLCDYCGYMGYIDRPSKEWLVNFYSKEWDTVFSRKVKDVKNNTAPLKNIGKEATRYQAFSLVEKMEDLDKNRLVCEIGCGYGEVLKNFETAGFKNLIGIENSAHRAEVVNKAFGFKTIHGDFGSEQVQEELVRFAPIGLIFSHHVLEHTYNPGEIIKKISALQKEGDYLILALPNGAGEHINFGLFYLVHLHAFTKESLEILLNKNNYEIIADKSPNETDIIIAAKKVASPQSGYRLADDYCQRTQTRIAKGLAFDKIKDGRLYQLYWQQTVGELDRVLAVEPRTSFSWYWRKLVAFVRVRLLRRFSPYYSMLVQLGKNQKLNEQDPIVVKFSENIKFLIK